MGVEGRPRPFDLRLGHPELHFLPLIYSINPLLFLPPVCQRPPGCLQILYSHSEIDGQEQVKAEGPEDQNVF